MPTYAIAEMRPGSPVGFEPRGGALKLWRSHSHEVILSGPAETGKTYACLQKLDAMLWKHAGATAVILRKTLSSLHTTVLRTYQAVVRPADPGAEPPIRFYGGEKPEWADYPNGSRVYFGGMDNPQKALSSERDFIYVNQAEELTLADWETLTTRCTGRAGVAPRPQIIGDCNPGPPSHWILHRDSIELWESRHEDNPVLFDDAGAITPQGEKSLAVLDRLTGVRKDRLRYGRWVQAEGVVYEGFDKAIHIIDAMPPGWESWRKLRSVDFGYTNPFVCQWWAIDGDARMYLYREVYRTQRMVADHVETIRTAERWHLADGKTPNPARERIEATVADHDAEDRATLHRGGVPTQPAYKAIRPGIQAVEGRLRVAGDGRPRLFILRLALIERDESLAATRQPSSTADEFELYSWPKGQDGRPLKEVPLDLHNHGMDAMRYAVAHVDRIDRLGAGGRPATGGPAHATLTAPGVSR